MASTDFEAIMGEPAIAAATSDRYGSFGSPSLSAAEAKQLRWLLDGGIMDAAFRERLRRSWGLCPRHAWAFALVEVELRGGLPFATSVLVEDLLLTGGRRGLGRRLLPARRRLAPSGSCPTCAYVDEEPQIESSWTHDAEQAARARRMHALIATHREDLRRWSCPECLGGVGVVCRPHVLTGCAAPKHLDDELHALAVRVRAWLRSTEPDGPMDLDARTAIGWAEGLGWLAGWDAVAAWDRG